MAGLRTSTRIRNTYGSHRKRFYTIYYSREFSKVIKPITMGSPSNVQHSDRQIVRVDFHCVASWVRLTPAVRDRSFLPWYVLHYHVVATAAAENRREKIGAPWPRMLEQHEMSSLPLGPRCVKRLPEWLASAASFQKTRKYFSVWTILGMQIGTVIAMGLQGLVSGRVVWNHLDLFRVHVQLRSL